MNQNNSRQYFHTKHIMTGIVFTRFRLELRIRCAVYKYRIEKKQKAKYSPLQSDEKAS